MEQPNPKRIVIDLDETICFTTGGDYRDSRPNQPVIDKLRWYKSQGWDIAIFSARNMRTHAGNLGKIAAFTLPVVIDWLQRHDVPFDEIFMGKPWCGTDGFYVDDKAIRPDEFAALDHAGIMALVSPRAPRRASAGADGVA
jgi:capsule biosynthesis phosphatase